MFVKMTTVVKDTKIDASFGRSSFSYQKDRSYGIGKDKNLSLIRNKILT